MSEQQKFKYKTNALDNEKLRLRTKNSQGKFANAHVSVVRNNPRITVFTGEPELITEENKYGIIVCPMGVVDFEIFIDTLRRVIASRDTQEFKFGCKTVDRNSDDKIVSIIEYSVIHVGRDNNGIYLKFSTPTYDGIRFDFEMSDFHYIVKPDGTSLSKSESSQIVASSWMKAIDKLVSQVIATNYYEYTREEKQRAYVPDRVKKENSYQNNRNYGNRYRENDRDNQNRSYPKKPYNSRDNYQQREQQKVEQNTSYESIQENEYEESIFS